MFKDNLLKIIKFSLLFSQFEKISKKSNKRVILFVDGSNLYHSIKQLGVNPGKIDYHCLFKIISKNQFPIVRFYTAPKRAEQGKKQRALQQSFFESLKQNPNLSIHFGKLQLVHKKPFLSFREKGVDVKLAVDLITTAKEYDIGILISGDTDLVPAVEVATKKDKRIINAYFSMSSGKELRDKSGASFRITKEILKKCMRTRQ
jgi:uncharacterized LabA/DUF88 family protein